MNKIECVLLETEKQFFFVDSKSGRTKGKIRLFIFLNVDNFVGIN